MEALERLAARTFSEGIARIISAKIPTSHKRRWANNGRRERFLERLGIGTRLFGVVDYWF
jgi:hypothetical protein